MFERITPEAAGISSVKVRELIELFNRRAMPMHSLLMMKGDKLFAEYYWAPFNKDFCHRMYSETKSYTSVAIGLLAEEGKLDINDPIVRYFPEKVDLPLPEQMKKQTIREMLMMTTVGQSFNWFTDSHEDRTYMYFNRARRDTDRAAGTIWEYDSAGSQVLSSLVEKLSGMSTFDYLNEKIFKHLGTFKTATMLKTRNGDSWGDSALVCTARDMISFARFVMNYGVWDGKRLMNEEYLRAATARQVDSHEFDSPVYQHGYGYQIWRTEDNGFAFNGMGSQFTICLPDKDLIFVCNADTQGMPNASDFIVSAFFELIARNISSAPINDDPVSQKRLEELTADMKLVAITGAEDSPMRAELDGAVYECLDNRMGIKRFSLHFSEDGRCGELHYTNAQGDKILPFGINHNVFGKFPQLGYSNDFGGLRTTDGFMYDDAISAAWLQDNKLAIKVQIIDRYFGNGLWFFAFKGKDATVYMKKTAEDFLAEYEGYAVAKRKD